MSLTCVTATAAVASLCQWLCQIRVQVAWRETTDRSVWESHDASDRAGLHTLSLFLCLTIYTVPWLRWAGSASSHPYRGCLVGICFGSISAPAGKENSGFCTMTWRQVLSSHSKILQVAGGTIVGRGFRYRNGVLLGVFSRSKICSWTYDQIITTPKVVTMYTIVL